MATATGGAVGSGSAFAGSVGIGMLYSFATEELDLMTTHNPGVTWVPAQPGFYFRPIAGDLVITDFAASGGGLTQGPITRAGNDTNLTNIWGNGQNASINPSSTAINNSALQSAAGGLISAATVPFRVGFSFQVGRLVNLATPIRLDVTTAILFAGSDVTVCAGKFVVFGQLFPIGTFP